MLRPTPAVFRQTLVKKIRGITEDNFEPVCMEVFRYQANENQLYKEFLHLLEIDATDVTCLEEIPCLPIQLFKNYRIKTGEWAVSEVFTSSGTTGTSTSMHLLRDPNWYRNLSIQGFEKFYGSIDDWCILALLPAYLERQGSSLVYMVDQFMQASAHPLNGFYLDNLEALNQQIQKLKDSSQKVLLLGVSFALLDFAEQYPPETEGHRKLY